MKLLGKKQMPLCRCCEHDLVTKGYPPDPQIGPVCAPCGERLYHVEQLLKGIEGYGKCLPVGPDSGKGVLS